MKTFKFVLVSLCIMSMLTSWVSIEAKKKEEEAPAPLLEPTKEETLLTEIRDLLKK